MKPRKFPKPTREEVERMFADVKPLLGAPLTEEEKLRDRLNLTTKTVILWFRREYGLHSPDGKLPTREDGFNRLCEMYVEAFESFSNEERHRLLAIAHAENAVRKLY